MKYSKGVWRSTFNSKKERAVRNDNGFICFLPKPYHYSGQDARYNDELRENEANAALIAFAPEMMDFIQDIAFPKRGANSENWSIEDASEAAKNLISRLNASISE